MLVRKKKISMFALAAVAAGLALTACDNNGTDATSSSRVGSSSSTQSPAAPSKSGAGSTSGTSTKAGVSCTNQINYAGDSRSNAEINT
ncbi:hypothetical protein ACIP9I_27790, partial [Streptomyces sp. NPDC088348]